MIDVFLKVLLCSICFFSCAKLDSQIRLPASLKYKEFAFDRSFFFNKENCENTEGPYLLRDDYEFNDFRAETGIRYHGSRSGISQRFNELNTSKKRLKKRLFIQDGQFRLPHSDTDIHVKKEFLNSLAHQIELAFKMNVVEHLYYPDFGHGHLYLPEEHSDISMEETLARTDLRIVYHTAEKLMMKSGPGKRDPIEYRQFRYRTRNLIGGFDEKASLEVHYAHSNETFNTLHEIPGEPNYEKKGGSLYISAHRNGCIGYKRGANTYYFDISFHH